MRKFVQWLKWLFDGEAQAFPPSWGGVIVIIITLCFVMGGMWACSKPSPEFKASYHMLFQSEEVLSGHETVKLYYDVSNENLCYLYYYDGSDVAHQMTCVKQPRF